MAVRVNKSAFNIREKINELTKRFGLKGSEIMAAETVQEARDLVSAGRKNLIINGGFDVWQRGTSFTNNNTIRYTTDRWQVYGVSTSVLDITRQAFTAGQTEVEGNPKYYIRLDNTPDVDNTWIELFQRIEDVTYFSNITVTLSFWIKSNRSFTNNNYFKFKQNFGSGGSSEVNTDSSNFDISTSWEKKTLTVTLPSVSGKTIGDNNYLEVHLLQNSSVQADTQYDIAQVQLEVGKNATDFEHRSYGEELALCQRYFYRKTTFSAKPMWSYSSTAGSTQLEFPTEMRSNPTFSYGGTLGADILVYYGPITNYITYTGFSGSTSSNQCMRLNFSGATGITVGHALGLYVGSNGYFDFSAEL